MWAKTFPLCNVRVKFAKCQILVDFEQFLQFWFQKWPYFLYYRSCIFFANSAAILCGSRWKRGMSTTLISCMQFKPLYSGELKAVWEYVYLNNSEALLFIELLPSRIVSSTVFMSINAMLYNHLYFVTYCQCLACYITLSGLYIWNFVD